MYNELYTAWRREVEESPLGKLPPDFYLKISDYIKRLKEEKALPDKKSVKLNLLDHESKNVAFMLEELLSTRYRKLLETISQNQALPSELLTVEEAKMCESFVSFAGVYQKFTRELLQGQSIQPALQVATVQSEPETGHKRATLRFTKAIPAIIGADMKPYGPFKVEDVASLPVENAKMLVKQGLAVMVDVS
jgi:DNA replication factor GINS